MENPIEFSKKSRKAIFFFILFFLVIVILPRFISLFQKPTDFEFTQTDFQKKEFKKKYQFVKKNYSKNKYSKSSKYKTPPKKFDPNKYSPTDWMKLGMSQKQADLIIRFGKRGFYSNDDLRKVFVISDEFFNVIRDSLYYPEKQELAKTENFKEQKKLLIELNSASEEELMKIPGIGAFFAKNIIKRRDALGGFISKNQLLEVWKMDEEKLKSIEEFISVDETLIKKIDLNEISAEELKKNPYLNWNCVNSIIKMRTQLGEYKNIEEIKRSVLIDDQLFNKLKPYLTI